MLYEKLGNTDVLVSKICLGTMTFGEQNTEQDGHAQMDYAYDRGINFIDTAELYSVPPRQETYGSTERIIGTWLKKKMVRHKIVLATKIGGPRPDLHYMRKSHHFSSASLKKALDDSLSRLQTDFVDIYQLHWPERKTNFFGKLGYTHDPKETWQDNFLEILLTVEELIKSGKIRYFGVSNETPWGLMHFLSVAEKHNLPRCVSIQNPYSLVNRTFEIGLAEISLRESVGLLAYSPLGFGRLTGKYELGLADKQSRINQFQVMSRYNNERTKTATNRYLEIAAKYKMSPTQMALSYVNSRPFVTSNIIGATNLIQLKENIDSIQIQLPNEAIEAIEQVHLDNPNPAP